MTVATLENEPGTDDEIKERLDGNIAPEVLFNASQDLELCYTPDPSPSGWWSAGLFPMSRELGKYLPIETQQSHSSPVRLQRDSMRFRDPEPILARRVEWTAD